MEVLGDPPWRTDGPRCESVRVWGSMSRDLGSHLGAKMGKESAKLAILGSTWEVLGACWEHFGSILAHGLDGRKPTKTLGKHMFFGVLGC